MASSIDRSRSTGPALGKQLFGLRHHEFAARAVDDVQYPAPGFGCKATGAVF